MQIFFMRWKNIWAPVIFAMALAPVFFSVRGQGQNPNPGQSKPAAQSKPSPTPKPPDDEEYEVVRISSNLVVVPVSVTDAAGQPVPGLKVEDFRLQEEGRDQPIAQIGDPEQVPLEIALLIDISGSTNASFEFEKEAAARFLKQVLKPEDRAAIFIIDRTPLLRQTSSPSDTAVRGLLSLQPAADKGPTAFFDTMVDAAKYLGEKTSPRHRRVVVAITDGVDNFSEKIKKAIGETSKEQAATSAETRRKVYDRALVEVQREVQRADAVFYSINPSGNTMHLNVMTQRGQDGMEQLAAATGGSAFVPLGSANLDSVFQHIASELRAQYLLQYYSGDESPKGKFLHIKVAVPMRPAVRVRAREGYYVTRK
ncbi:MAG: Ca-activated chloride channel [Blastocatellia bacterium]|nr:Ca-activated chloride channel [Blastocatellia bacterium]